LRIFRTQGPVWESRYRHIPLVRRRICQLPARFASVDDPMNVRSTLLLPVLLLIAGSATTQSSPRQWIPLRMSSPKAIRTAKFVGAKAASDVLHLSIGLTCRDEAGLQRFADDVSNPKSAHYRQFVKPEDVGRMFGLSASDVKSVSDYLIGQGMTVRLVAKNRLSILADATVAQAQTAFRTTIEEFVLSDVPKGSNPLRFAFTTPPSVPMSIKPFVTVIGGLENVVRPKPLATLTCNQLRTLYSVAPIYNSSFQGQGRTVAISNWDGYRLSNIPLMIQQFGLPAPSAGAGTNVSVVSIGGEDGNTSTYAGEGDIDIQCVLGMAPLCNLIIYDNANSGDYLGVVTQEAEDNLADIVTESYGWSPDTATFEQVHAVHLSMTSQGITYMNASGDSGADGVPGYPYPDEEPENLVVGGTSVITDGLGNRTSEVVWDNTIGAGGGGWTPNTDPFNILPSWQKGTGVPTGIPYRLSPDISLDADPDSGYDIFIGGQEQDGWGGTSCASPTFAGSLADCEQQLIAAGALSANSEGKQRLGRIQDLLYSYNGDPTVFYDITSGTNGTLPSGDPSNAAPGWDTASGWGAPILNGLVDKILNIPVPTAFTLSPTTVLGGASATGTLSINLPAPSVGFVFSLTSDSSFATVPATVTVPAGATSCTFSVGTTGTTSTGTANLTAAAAGVTLSAALTVTPTSLQSISASPNTIVGGTASLGTISLNGAAPVLGYDIALTSSDPSVTVPQNVEVAEGATSDLFSINTSAVTSVTTVTLTGTLNGATVSTTITVTPGALGGMSVTPSSIAGGSTATGTLTMNGTAPTGGLAVSLSASNLAASVPSTVTIPAGASSATFTVSTHPVTAGIPVTITATQGANTFTANLTVTAANLSSVTLTPSSVVGGGSSSGTVTLAGVVAGSAVTVSLSSSNSAASVPASVTVPVGASSATFTVTTTPVASPVTAVVTGKQGAYTVTANLTINAPSLQAVSVSPTSVAGGSSATGTVSLNGAAGPGGLSVSLSSNSASASVPASVTIPAGASSTSFAITTSSVATDASVTITASARGSSQTATLTVMTPLLLGVSIAPSAVVGGNPAVGTVTLARAAPSGGATISLLSSVGFAGVPSSVTVPAGATSGSFNVSTSGVSAASTATITGVMNGTNKTAALVVQPASLVMFTISPGSVSGGSSAIGTLSLNGVAPTGGVKVSLASNNLAVTVSSSVTIPAGASGATFAVNTKAVAAQANAVVSAKSAAVSLSAPLAVEPASLESVSLSPNQVVGGSTATVTGTVTFSGIPASTGGSVKLASSDPTVVSVPVSVRGSSSASSVTFAVTHRKTLSTQVVTISATYGGVTKTGQVTVTPFEIVSLSISPGSVPGGKGASGTISLNATPGASSGAISIKLGSSVKAVSTPATVSVSVGKPSATFNLTTSPVATTTTATITGTIGGSSQQANLTLEPPTLESIAVKPSTIQGGPTTTVIGTVTLSGPAPTGGVVVGLTSSDPVNAAVATSVTVPAGKTGATFKVAHKAVTSTDVITFTASLAGISKSTTLTINP
jgi:subtilase family serine protease